MGYPPPAKLRGVVVFGVVFPVSGCQARGWVRAGRGADGGKGKSEGKLVGIMISLFDSFGGRS